MSEYKVGDIVKLKKPHPCGGLTWLIKRVGIDFRIKCTTCEHEIMISRNDFEKRVKSIISKT